MQIACCATWNLLIKSALLPLTRFHIPRKKICIIIIETQIDFSFKSSKSNFLLDEKMPLHLESDDNNVRKIKSMTGCHAQPCDTEHAFTVVETQHGINE